MKRSNSSKKWFILVLFAALMFALTNGSGVNAAGWPIGITVLYDNYTLTEGCTSDWGFACLIKGTDKCILFDTGTNGDILLRNMDKLQVSAGDVEVVVISHDHTDHTGGLASFLERNSNVTAYLPLTVSASLIKTVESRGAKVRLPDNLVQTCEEMCKGVRLADLTFMNQVEQFLILETPKGLVVITGCAHPGIVQIIQTTKQLLGKDIYFVFGGFHLLEFSDSEDLSIIDQFRSLGVRKVGASHCTGERAIALFKQQYGEHFVPIGIGPLPIPVVFEEVLPFRLIAYWKLDETEGGIADNSADDNDGIIHGEPVWKPTEGRKAGALQLDGIDDYMSTPFVLDPADGPFSVFTWIKGGKPGGVVISQIDGLDGSGETWLGTEPVSGKLMTGLVTPPAGRFSPKPLVSESVITDNQWHHIGFAWDGIYRSLYVDGIEVAKDAATQAALKPATGGLYISASKTLETGSFFSGLIDDIRVYNRALIAGEISALAH